VAVRIPTKFDRYSFADTGESFVLSDTQRQHIQNFMADDAEQRLGLQVDTLNVSAFVQAEAYLKGRMEFAQYLLDISIANISSNAESPGE
jgi:hypothetical protein